MLGIYMRASVIKYFLGKITNLFDIQNPQTFDSSFVHFSVLKMVQDVGHTRCLYETRVNQIVEYQLPLKNILMALVKDVCARSRHQGKGDVISSRAYCGM